MFIGKRHKGSIIVSFIVVIVAPISNAFACDPPEGAPRTVAERFAFAEVVFLGTPVAVRRDSLFKQAFGSSQKRVRFKIEKQWKGARVSSIEVYDDDTSCGLGFDRMLNNSKVLLFGVFEGDLVKPLVLGGAVFLTRPGHPKVDVAAEKQLDELEKTILPKSRE